MANPYDDDMLLVHDDDDDNNLVSDTDNDDSAISIDAPAVPAAPTVIVLDSDITADVSRNGRNAFDVMNAAPLASGRGRGAASGVAGRGRGRGRPIIHREPLQQLQDLPLGDAALDLQSYSVFLGTANRDIPSCWLDQYKVGILDVCEASEGVSGAVALERGARKNSLHAQSFITIRALREKPGEKQIRDVIKAVLNITSTDGAKVTVKKFIEGQTEIYMLGYVQKDFGKPHYRILHTSDITEIMLADARRQYNTISVDFSQAKIKLTRSNLDTNIYRF
eukprot:gene31934-40316_t